MKKILFSLISILFSFLSRRSNILLAFLCVGGLLSAFSIANAIEVGGHLTEDTIWSPDNNPYLVTEILYVDAGVTLNILPGTEIKISGASCTSWYEYNQNFWLYSGVSVAKMIQVDGKIITEGTEQDSIVFTRMQGDPDYYWGCIYITEQSEMPIFKYCRFEYSAGIGIATGNTARGGISIRNGTGLLVNCTFINNGIGISAYYNLTRNIEVSGCYFSYDDNINNFVENIWGGIHLSIFRPEANYKPALIANNVFINNRVINVKSIFYVDNYNTNCLKVLTGYDDNTSYFYNNEFTNCETGIKGIENSYLYIKKNRFIGGSYGVDIDYAYVEISDNYFEGCEVYTEFATGLLKNNISNNGEIWTPGEIEIYNNICYNSEGYGLKVGYNPYCVNNISINNKYDIWTATETYENCVIIMNEELTQHTINGDPIFRNCIIDFPLEYPLIDGGGNIWVDSLQAQTLFEDIQNGDFHLIEGSLAIDAGFDTLGYYYPFDMDYHHRVWDGDNNGNSIIDIGPYEYNSPSFGGIEGYTYNPTNGDPVDYVLLKINNQPGEFTFSDSIGNFQYKLPAGIYDIYAERVFYDDVIEYQIEVFDGQFTQISIPMTETLDVDDHEIIPAMNDFNLTNFPNPFNSSTTIYFVTTRLRCATPWQANLHENARIEIYNVKGQKVKTLDLESASPSPYYADGVSYSIIWNGTDDNNKPVTNGIYLYKLSTYKKDIIKKMIILK